MTDAAAARLAAWAPAAIAAYVLLLIGVRVALSGNLEYDEAQFVGQVDLRLVYGNAHPPLYNWMVRAALEATGWNWPLALALVKYPLLGLFHLFTFLAARRLGGPRAGVLALAASALLPQVVWMAAHTLAHSVMLLAAIAASVHAAALIAAGGGRGAFVGFGAAAALGMLAKFNFALWLAPFCAALALTPGVRAAFLSRRLWLAAAVFGALAGPALVAAALNLQASTNRLDKLYAARAAPWWDVPGLGVDGVVSLAVGAVAFVGPLALVWALAGARRPAADAPPLARALGWAMAGSAGLFALILLAADMRSVDERYLIPVLAAAPVWAAVARAPRRAGAVAALAGALYLAAPLGMAGMTALGGHRWAQPYDAVADALAQAAPPGPPAVASNRFDLAANVAIRLGAPMIAEGAAAPPGPVALVWRGDGPPPALFADRAPLGPPLRIAAATRNLARRPVVYSAVWLEAASVTAPGSE